MTKYDICRKLDEVCERLDAVLSNTEANTNTTEIRLAKRAVRDIQISILEDLEKEYSRN